MNGTLVMSDQEQIPLRASNSTSGFNKLRLRLEKSSPSLSKKNSANLDDSLPKKSSSFFTKPLIMSSHRKQKSMDEVIYETGNLDLSNNISRSISPQKIQMTQLHNTNMDETPEIDNVSNFSSPSKSIISNDLPENFSLSPPQGPSMVLPKIDITEPHSPPRNLISKSDSPSKESNSKFGRLRKKTLSMFFDQSSNSLIPASSSRSIDDPNSMEFPQEEKLQRPRLAKSHSDNQRANDSEEIDPLCTTTNALKIQQDLTRKRSKTMGSVENDLYHKRNGSIVKTIGSMMMLKPKHASYDSSTSVSQTSLESDSPFNTAPPTPPPAQEGDTPDGYIQLLKDEGFEFEITSILATSDSEFGRKCLTKYISERFDFHEIPVDIALRMFLMFCDLPKEAQQIDRVLECFSQRYYECNIELWDNHDQVYFLTFSLVMLHTDFYNVNNKKKMTREDFVKNTRVDNGDSISNSFLTKEILEYLYDNVVFTKFVKRYQLNTHHTSQTIYSLPKRLFSSASSNNLDGMNQTTNAAAQSPNLRSQSFSSTTSQIFSSAPVIDPYQAILSEQLNFLKLDPAPINFENPFEKGSTPDPFNLPNLANFRENILGNPGLYIRYNKDCNWLTSKTEINFRNSDETEYGKRVLLKVIKVDEIYREETVTNNKFFTMGSTSRVIWKKYYGFLTTCGFFLFDTLNFLSISERQEVIQGDFAKDNGEPFIIDILLDFILRSCLKYCINGLFAYPTTDEDARTFNLYSTNKKEIFSVNTTEDLTSWVSAINYVAALESCIIDKKPENNHEVTPLRNTPIEDKITKLQTNKDASVIKINYYLQIIQHIKILTPFSHRTRENLINHYKSLGIKIDWLWYEIERNMVYTEILRHELDFEDTVSVRSNDQESFLEESFINDDYYKKSSFDNSNSQRQPLKLANDSLDSIIEDENSEEEFVDATG